MAKDNSKRIRHGQKRGSRKNFGTLGAAESLAAAIVLANEAKADYTAHIADTGAHSGGADSTNTVVADDASDLASLITLVSELVASATSYEAHENDNAAGAGSYHAAQRTADYSLASNVAPTDLAECWTRLTDFKAKFNLHDADDTGHDTVAGIIIASPSVASVVQNISFKDQSVAEIVMSEAVALQIVLQGEYDGAELLIKVTSPHANDTMDLQLNSTNCSALASTAFVAEDVNYARVLVIDAANDVSVVEWLVS